MTSHGYKKYMKKEAQSGSPILKIFIITFFGMLLVFTFIFKSLAPSVDTSIGDYKESSSMDIDEQKKIVDDRLQMIQSEDQGKSFSELIKSVDDTQSETQEPVRQEEAAATNDIVTLETTTVTQQEPIYKVFVGSYTSAEQARVAKEIIQESGNGLNPIVKCIGSNSYTLQVGIFKNKQSAEAMLSNVQQHNLPGRIVQDY